MNKSFNLQLPALAFFQQFGTQNFTDLLLMECWWNSSSRLWLAGCRKLSILRFCAQRRVFLHQTHNLSLVFDCCLSTACQNKGTNHKETTLCLSLRCHCCPTSVSSSKQHPIKVNHSLGFAWRTHSPFGTQPKLLPKTSSLTPSEEDTHFKKESERPSTHYGPSFCGLVKMQRRWDARELIFDNFFLERSISLLIIIKN